MRNKRVKVLIVGSGGNGISPAAYLTMNGETDFHIITKHNDFGGAWLQNGYPGCEVDSPSAVYQLSYFPYSGWSTQYAKQPEVRDYLRRAAAHFGLYERTSFGCELLYARWSEYELCWVVDSTKGEWRADFLVLATGFLEEPVFPKIEGVGDFTGQIFHTSHWPEGYTGSGDRVAVLGTGSSGIQVIAELQKVAAHVTVFQRTAAWVIPKPNPHIDDAERASYHRAVLESSQLQGDIFETLEDGWSSVHLGQDIDRFERIARDYLHEQVPPGPLRDALTPNHRYGCKRPLRSSEYLWAVQQPNVTLVPMGASRITSNSVFATDGAEYKVDTIVMATGFVFGGTILNRIHRRDGQTVAQYHRGHPRAYKSVSLSGCPNLILAGGPAPNGQIFNGLYSGEAAGKYLVTMMQTMASNGIRAMEVTQSAEDEWKKNADNILRRGSTVSGGCANYSQDSEGNNKAAWPGSLKSMARELSIVDLAKYYKVA